jgi:hypothetical protein
MTETLYSLGLGGRIVGVTNVCDRPGPGIPAGIAELEKCINMP